MALHATSRRLTAELIGTAGLLLAVVGSGITASADGEGSSQLFQHAVIVGAVLAALIAAFGPVSGAHLNPVVTLVDAFLGGIAPRLAAGYVLAQLAGAVLGTVGANLLHGLPAATLATTSRSGVALAASEGVATFGLLLVIFGVVRAGARGALPAMVGAWVAGAIYVTSSAAFANPAVTVARVLSDTYTGIAPRAVPAFLGAQLAGALAAGLLIAWLHPAVRGTAARATPPPAPDPSVPAPD